MENDKNEFEELLVLYALGELEPDEALVVEKELQKRPELAAEVEKVRRADGLLSDVFAQSDEAAQQAVVEKSVKPKAPGKPETSESRLAYRLAFSAAALALIVVTSALLFPQFFSKDVPVAMSPSETVEDKSAPARPVTEGVKLEEPAPAAEETLVQEEVQEEVQETQETQETQEEPAKFALNAMDDAVVAAEDVEENADEAIPPAAAAAVDADMAEDDVDIVPAAPNYAADPDFAPLNTAAPAPAAAPAAALPMAEENVSLGEEPAVRNAMKSSAPEEVHAEYYMRNALYDVPSQKTSRGMAPIKGAISPMKEELLQESTLGDMAVDQMNKRLNSRRKVNSESKAFELNRTEKGVVAADAAPALDSYASLRKSVMEENKLPNPESVKVEQWLNYFGVAEPVKAKEQERNSEAPENKDAQFVKAVNQFAAALSSSEPADVKAFEEVLDLLKNSVGDDAKRLEFKAIVEKTIEIVKKRSE